MNHLTYRKIPSSRLFVILQCQVLPVLACQHPAWNPEQNLPFYYVNFIFGGLNISGVLSAETWHQPSEIDLRKTIDNRIFSKVNIKFFD